MRFYENEQGKYRDGDIAERVIKKDCKNYLEIRPFNSRTVSKRLNTPLATISIISDGAGGIREPIKRPCF